MSINCTDTDNQTNNKNTQTYGKHTKIILDLGINPQQLALDHVLFIRLKAYNCRNCIVFDSEHSPEMSIFEK